MRQAKFGQQGSDRHVTDWVRKNHCVTLFHVMHAWSTSIITWISKQKNGSKYAPQLDGDHYNFSGEKQNMLWITILTSPRTLNLHNKPTTLCSIDIWLGPQLPCRGASLIWLFSYLERLVKKEQDMIYRAESMSYYPTLLRVALIIQWEGNQIPRLGRKPLKFPAGFSLSEYSRSSLII